MTDTAAAQKAQVEADRRVLAATDLATLPATGPERAGLTVRRTLINTVY